MRENWEKYAVQIGVRKQLGAKLRVTPEESDSGIAVVEHTLPARKLGAPLHRHTREDEISFVLEGTLAVQEGGEVSIVETGEVAVKERGLWHTFWNPGPKQVRFLEVIAPGEFAGYFKEIAELLPDDGERDSETMKRIDEIGEKYGFESDPASVPELIEQHGLQR